MPGMSNAEETAVLNHEYRTATYTKPTNRWLALWVGDPTDTGSGGAEVTGTAYARVAIPCADAQWAAPADDGGGNQQITNAAVLTFPTPGGTWSSGSTITHWATMDASTAGNVVDYGAITSPFVVLSGNAAPSVAIGALVIKRG